MPTGAEQVNLTFLRTEIDQAITDLLDERDAALQAGKLDVAEAAQAEAEKLAPILATIQHIINEGVGINLRLLAERIENSIQAQTAIGLSKAVATLEAALQRIMPPVTNGADTQVDAAKPGDKKTGGKKPGDTPPAATQPVAATKITAKPGAGNAILTALIGGSEAVSLDPIMVLTIVAIESDFKPNAQNPRSSAGGLFQFIDGTWTGAGGKKVPGRGGIGNGHAAHAPLDEQIGIGCKFTRDNLDKLTRELGRLPTTTGVYMAHQQGLAGALKILKASRSARIESVIGTQAAVLNGMGGLTVTGAIEKFERLVRVHTDQVNDLVTVAETVAATVAPPPNGSVAPIAELACEKAIEELEHFGRRSDGTTVRETDDPLNTRVIEYFRRVGVTVRNGAQEPWSAAFISFVMRQAGANPQLFPFSPSHSTYIFQALENRIRNRLDASLVYFDSDEVTVRVGDLIGRSRTDEVKSRKDIEDRLPASFFKSHTDLVIDVRPSRITTIGGNLSDTIRTQTRETDGDGRLIEPKFAFVLRTNF